MESTNREDIRKDKLYHEQIENEHPVGCQL